VAFSRESSISCQRLPWHVTLTWPPFLGCLDSQFFNVKHLAKEQSQLHLTFSVWCSQYLHRVQHILRFGGESSTHCTTTADVILKRIRGTSIPQVSTKYASTNGNEASCLPDKYIGEEFASQTILYNTSLLDPQQLYGKIVGSPCPDNMHNYKWQRNTLQKRLKSYWRKMFTRFWDRLTESMRSMSSLGEKRRRNMRLMTFFT
jgi:hypothetical protein